MKTCSTCGIEKPGAEFYFTKKNSGLLRPQCKKCLLATNRKWVIENPVAACGVVKKWNKKNRKKIGAYEKKRYHADQGFKLRKILRSRLTTVLKRRGLSKSLSALDLIGCPPVWLEAWVEYLFKPGMTWENSGKVWHLDHIKPCAAFDLCDLEQQRICFHWTNLQPLFAEENMQKGDKYAPSN